MAKESPVMVADNKPFTGWTSLSIRAALNEVAREFRADVTEIPDGNTDILATWHFPPNTAVQWKVGDDLLLDGFVDTYAPRGDATSHSIALTGRGKGRDFADSSVWHSSGQFEEKKVEDITKELDTGNAGVKATADTGPPVEVFRVQQGATQFSQILRLCQQRKLTCKGAKDGSIEITRAGTVRHAGSLVHGDAGTVRIKSYAGEISARMRFSDYATIGQSCQLFDEPQIRPVGKSKSDPVMAKSPGRKKVVVDQAQTDPTLCRQRADWEQARTAGNSAQADLVVWGWRDEAGTLWEPGNLIYVEHRWLHLKQDLLVQVAEFIQDGSGTYTNLKLVDPRTFAGDESRYNNSDPFWGQ